MPDLLMRRAAFRQLHESGCFVIPNPWDIGSARYLSHLGFKALATTSSGSPSRAGSPTLIGACHATPCWAIYRKSSAQPICP